MLKALRKRVRKRAVKKIILTLKTQRPAPPQNPPPPSEQQEQEKAQAQAGSADENEDEDDTKKGDEHKGEADKANDVLSQLSQEEQQSLKQWLQRIPDNPGELLRIKFRNNTLLKQRQTNKDETPYNGNPW